MQTDAIVIPWFDSGCPYRRKNFDRVLGWWRDFFPPAKIYAPEGSELNRGALKNAGAREAINNGAETLIFCDADILPTAAGINDVHRFITDNVVYLYDGLWMTDSDGHQWMERGHLGGLFAVSTRMYDLVGGFPEFPDYGAEDIIFEVCVATLGALTARSDAEATHLYHPVTDQTFQGPHFDLCKKYEAARGDKRKVKRLIGQRK